MRRYFDSQLETLHTQIIEMGAMVEEAIEDSIKALENRDIELARQVMERDMEVNAAERDIEKQCLNLILRQQPVAKDLRDIGSALKIITDMERIGDQASDIAEITIRLIKEGSSYQVENIPKMAATAMSMVKQSVTAFVETDTALAQEIIRRDDQVDALFDKVKQQLVDMITKDKVAFADTFANLLMIAKYLERIADHATNIAEWIQFSVTGRHS